MTLEGFNDCRARARHERQSARYATAGLHYRAAAHELFGESRRVPEYTDDLDPHHYVVNTGRGITNLLRAALCFRLGDEPIRAQLTCEEGILLGTDAAEHESVFVKGARQGLSQEMIGDLRLFGNLGGHEQAYERAADLYEQCDNHIGWQAEPEFEYLIRLSHELADSTGLGMSNEYKHETLSRSLGRRIQFKQEQYPSILDRVLDRERWGIQ